MCHYVSLEVIIPCAFVLTLHTAERLFSGMKNNVSFQIISCCGQGSTHGASVGFISSLLCFGLGSKTHCTKFSGTLAVSFRQWRSSFDLSLYVSYQSYGLTKGKFHDFSEKITLKSESGVECLDQ